MRKRKQRKEKKKNKIDTYERNRKRDIWDEKQIAK